MNLLMVISRICMQETAKVNEDAVRDSLICLSLVAASSSSGRKAILDNSGLSALLTAFTSESSIQLWAVRLLVSLLQELPSSAMLEGMLLR